MSSTNMLLDEAQIYEGRKHGAFAHIYSMLGRWSASLDSIATDLEEGLPEKKQVRQVARSLASIIAELAHDWQSID